MNKIITVAPEKCLACGSCTLNCAAAHSETRKLKTAVGEKTRPVSRMFIEYSGKREKYKIKNSFPVHCRHCEDAPCIKACPTRAIWRENAGEPVLIKEEKCIGCRYCVLACPFGVLELDEKTARMKKCDFCIERLKEGLEPACVAHCPTGCLKFTDEKEYTKEKRKKYFVEIEGRATTP